MTVPDHLERYLGPIDAGWRSDAEGKELPFAVVRFEPNNETGTVAFSTLGLARYALASPVSAKAIRHELVMLLPDDHYDGPVPGLLQQVATNALEADSALVRGQVLGPRGPLLENSPMEALYVAAPVYQPPSFGSCEEAGHTIVFAWLVPISASEARYIADHGWDAWEDLIVEADPDMTDPFRESIV